MDISVKHCVEEHHPVMEITIGNTKLRYENSFFQTFDDYVFIHVDTQIMYLDYLLSIFQKEKGQWKLIRELPSNDFPALFDLRDIFLFFLNKEVEENDYEMSEVSGHIEYTCHFQTGTLNDDFYSVSHTFSLENADALKGHFDFTVGGPFDDKNEDTERIVFHNLTWDNITTISDAIHKFISNCIDVHNADTKTEIQNSLKSWQVCGNHLYQMGNDNKTILSVYAPDDMLDTIFLFNGKLDENCYHSTNLKDIVISDIIPYGIIYESGYEEFDGRFRSITRKELADVNALLDVFYQPSDEVLYYGEEDICDDFFAFLNEDEKKEFNEMDEEFLFEKWKEAILNRYWMCREEHNFPKRVKDNGNHENVYETIRYIVFELKRKA